MLAYKNHEFVDLKDCTLSVYDLGVLVGAGVTDLARTFNGRPWMLGEHVDRLLRSCKYACIPSPKDRQQIIDIAEHLAVDNYKGVDLGIVFYITAGENSIYAGSAGIQKNTEPTFIVHTFPLPSHIWKKYFTEGVHCTIPHIRHIPPNMFDQRIKHRNRLHMWIAEQMSPVPGGVPIFLDEHGYVTETSGANVVVYQNGKIATPRRNMLNGLARDTLYDSAKKNNIEMAWADLTTYDLLNADEVWLTTTPYCLAPVTWLNGQDIGNGQPGPVWRKLVDSISAIVQKDIYAEIVG